MRFLCKHCCDLFKWSCCTFADADSPLFLAASACPSFGHAYEAGTCRILLTHLAVYPHALLLGLCRQQLSPCKLLCLALTPGFHPSASQPMWCRQHHHMACVCTQTKLAPKPCQRKAQAATCSISSSSRLEKRYECRLYQSAVPARCSRADDLKLFLINGACIMVVSPVHLVLLLLALLIRCLSVASKSAHGAEAHRSNCALMCHISRSCRVVCLQACIMSLVMQGFIRTMHFSSVNRQAQTKSFCYCWECKLTGGYCRWLPSSSNWRMRQRD